MRDKISKDTEDLNTTNQLDLTDVYRTLDPETAEHTSLSSAHETLFKIDDTIGCKTSNFRKVKITQSMFSDHNEGKPRISNRKLSGKFTNSWTLNNILLNQPGVKVEVSRELRKYVEQNAKERNRSQINNLSVYLEELEKEKIKSNTSNGKIIKI